MKLKLWYFMKLVCLFFVKTYFYIMYSLKLFVLCFDVSSDKSQTVFGHVCDSVYMR